MKPIFYKVKSTNECFKLVPVDNVSKEAINNLLDAIKDEGIEFITENEFEKSHDDWMDINLFDSTNKLIATLTTQKID